VAPSSRLRRIASAPGNLPAHNPRFVGPESEMRRLHEAAGLGQLGVLSAVHGIGGLGKTALAIQYSFAYADFYPGGRWLIGCAGTPNLAAAIRTLDSDLGVTFTDDEKLDDTRAAKRILQNLHERAERGAVARAGEPNPPQPRALFILDNIDDAGCSTRPTPTSSPAAPGCTCWPPRGWVPRRAAGGDGPERATDPGAARGDGAKVRGFAGWRGAS
jgi:hypothetical protein